MLEYKFQNFMIKSTNKILSFTLILLVINFNFTIFAYSINNMHECEAHIKVTNNSCCHAEQAQNSFECSINKVEFESSNCNCDHSKNFNSDPFLVKNDISITNIVFIVSYIIDDFEINNQNFVSVDNSDFNHLITPPIYKTTEVYLN